MYIVHKEQVTDGVCVCVCVFVGPVLGGTVHCVCEGHLAGGMKYRSVFLFFVLF